MDVQQVTGVARGVSDYGFMVMTASFFLLLSVIMMIAIFRWFKSMVDRMIEQQDSLHDLLSIMQESANDQKRLIERLEPETKLRIRNLIGFAFDLSIEQVCRLIKRIRKENHIINHEATQEKIRKSVQVIHDDRNSKFDPFIYNNKPLSEYCSESWVDDISKVVEDEIYHEDGENNERAYTNVKLAYDKIKTEFYQTLND